MAHNSKTVIKFTTPQRLKDQLQRLADERHISLSALVRLILTEYLKKQP